ncbi:MAG: hypothetical protein A2161_18750 [Candidatus Schekmanbacteria bacterium RBG_13_48_7]|uniref:DUF5615 domain-containing protein n=1 Tax=Candidatus Schekmanbacteria bacterium RBG_13_48_7 TaxID=1817878 RepID=A0A1F7S2G8_9BACT|nr:MAG: hypothetical protein A2161_18750 [Candidatus Schekmanbacteria bacterium RBG_13_48_7]
MNILDENIIESQCQLLRSWRIRFRQIGVEIGQSGLKDKEIITLLHGINHPTFFTRDEDFNDRNLCHAGYCLVYMAVRKDEITSFVKRLLRHELFKSKTKRMGIVVRVSQTGISIWRLYKEKHEDIDWEK